MSEFAKESAFANQDRALGEAITAAYEAATREPETKGKSITGDQIAQIQHILEDLEISVENHADEGTIFSLCDDVRDILDAL